MTQSVLSKTVLLALLGAACTLFSVANASADSVGLVPNDGCLSYAGAIFCDDDLRSSGTGTFDPFLLNSGTGSQPAISAWNTGADSGLTQPNMATLSQTDELAVGDVGTSVGGGVTYWTFILDLNQNNSDPLIDLTHLQLYSCPTDSYTDLSGCSSFYNLFGGAVTYTTQGNKDIPVISDPNWITFDVTNSGSGQGDIIVFIPTTAFSFAPTGWVALLDGFGNPPGDYENNDGFEEWKVIKDFQCPSGCGTGTEPLNPVPEPATLTLVGSALALAAARARRRKQR